MTKPTESELNCLHLEVVVSCGEMLSFRQLVTLLGPVDLSKDGTHS